MQEFETITMPEGGLGSFITSNLDEIDDNILMFGSGSGINSMKEVADRMAKLGREGDTFVVHASEKEVMVPKEVAEKNPELVSQIKDAIAAEGADPEAYIVGSANNSINPMTGQREFFLKKLVKGIKKVFKKAAKIVIPVALNYFFPGMGAIASSAIGAGIGGLIQGESFGDALKSAALGGLTAGVAAGVSGALGGEGFMAGVKGALPSRQVGFFTPRFNVPDAPGFLDPLGTGRAMEGVSQTSGSTSLPTPKQAADAVAFQKDMSALGQNITTDQALKSVSGMGFGKKALLTAGLGLGASALAGAFDPIPAGEIDLSGFGVNTTGSSDPTNVFASSTEVLEANPDKYRVGQPPPTNFITPTQALYSGQPITTAAFLPSQGTYNPIVPSATYANLLPTGAGTNPITPSQSSDSPEVAEVQLAGFNPRVTGMSPTQIFGIDSLGNPILSAYNVADAIMPARFVGSTPEVQTAADGGPMSREGQREMALSDFPRRTGDIQGPGTETSDDIPAMLSDGEFVMTARAVRGAGDGDRQKGFRKMYDIMRSFEGSAVA
jgi:hypothetical protein